VKIINAVNELKLKENTVNIWKKIFDRIAHEKALLLKFGILFLTFFNNV